MIETQWKSSFSTTTLSFEPFYRKPFNNHKLESLMCTMHFPLNPLIVWVHDPSSFKFKCLLRNSSHRGAKHAWSKVKYSRRLEMLHAKLLAYHIRYTYTCTSDYCTAEWTLFTRRLRAAVSTDGKSISQSINQSINLFSGIIAEQKRNYQKHKTLTKLRLRGAEVAAKFASLDRTIWTSSSLSSECEFHGNFS